MGKKITSNLANKARAQMSSGTSSGRAASGGGGSNSKHHHHHSSSSSHHHHHHNSTTHHHHQHQHHQSHQSGDTDHIGDTGGGGSIGDTPAHVSSGTGGASAALFAHIKSPENFKLLPRYSAALSRPHDDSLPPEDLDGIQTELETLLSTVARRAHALRHESLQLERGVVVGEDLGGASSSAAGGGGGGRGKRGKEHLSSNEKTPTSPGKRKRGGGTAAAAASAASSSDDKKKDKYYGGGGGGGGSGSGQRKVAKLKASASGSPSNSHHTHHTHHHHSQHHQSGNNSSSGGSVTSGHSHPHAAHAHHLTDDDGSTGAMGSGGSGGGSGSGGGGATADDMQPKLCAPKNDVPNKFWLSVEPYCMPISHEDIKLLDDLIEEYATPLVPAVPSLGPHYSQTWALEDMRDEQDGGNAHAKANRRFTSATGGTVGGGGGGGGGGVLEAGGAGGMGGGDEGGAERLEVMGMLRKGEKLMGEQVTGPLTQRLMAAFLEENVIDASDTAAATAPSAVDPATAPAPAPTAVMARNGVSLERRVKQELIEQGLLDADDFAREKGGADDEDEILGEIKRVRTELATIAEYNYSELLKLHQLAKTEMRRLEVKRQLDVVDLDIVEMYKRVAQIKQTKQQKRRRLTDAERAEVFRLTAEQKRLSDQLETFNR